MVERLTLGGYEQDYHGYAEQHLKKQRKLGRSFDPSQLITPPGTKVRVQLKEGDDLPEINMISFGRQKLKPRRKKISQQELQDPSDKVDYHVPRPKESSAYLAAPVVTPAFLWPSTSEIGPTMQLLSDVTPGGLIDYSYVPPPESLEDSPPEDPDQKIHMMEIQDYVDLQQVRQELVMRGFDPSQFTTSPGTKIYLQLKEDDDLPECNMVCSMPVQPITVKLPHRFPYETDHQVPWGYGLEVVTSTGVKIEPEVAEIGGMTRSGRCYTPEELESKRKKGKEKVGEAPGMEEAVKQGVTEQEIKEFLKVIRKSEYTVVEQLNRMPAQISILGLLIPILESKDGFYYCRKRFPFLYL